MERKQFSQTMASEWQTAFVVSHKMPWYALLTAVKNCNKSLVKLQDFFFKTETKTKCSRPRPRLHDPRPRPRLSFLSSRCLETRPWSRAWAAQPGGVGGQCPPHFWDLGVQGVQLGGRSNENDLCFYSRQFLFSTVHVQVTYISAFCLKSER